jgi:hypothetical protein
MIEGAGILLAAAVAYGIVKTKLSRMESDIVDLQLSMGGAVLKEECHAVQEACQEKICDKMDDLGDTVGKTIDNNTRKWQQVATLLGAICQKLHIPLPDWK